MSKIFARLTPLKSQSDELLHIDFLRFIASYAIVLYHFAPGAQGGLGTALSHCHHFYLAVDLFLVLSGFIISYVYEPRLHTGADYGTFLWRRVARLAPLHWATLLFFVVLGLLTAMGFHANLITNYDWDCLIPSILALQAFGICRRLSFNFVSWSISAEMGMYLIAPALLWLGRKRRWWPLLLSLCAMVALFGLSRGGAMPWYQWSWNFGVLRAIPDFSLGVSLFFCRAAIGRIPAARILLLAALSGFVIGSFQDWPDPLLLLFVYLAAMAGVACDITSGKIPGGRHDWVTALGAYGQLTYSMYMLHPLLLTVLVVIIGQHILHLGGTAMNCWLLLVIVLVVPVSYLSLELFETPARRWLAGAQRRRTPA
jgi:peptidoglycan/LPS O-acetylase OafA/YrhL